MPSKPKSQPNLHEQPASADGVRSLTPQAESHFDPMERSKSIRDDRWLQWNFFKGRAPAVKEIQTKIRSLAVVADVTNPNSESNDQFLVSWTDDPKQQEIRKAATGHFPDVAELDASSFKFFASRKEHLTVTPLVKLSHSGGKALVLGRHAQAQQEDLIPIMIDSTTKVTIHEKGVLPFSISALETEVTAGLLFACHLKQSGVLKNLHCVPCNKYRSGAGCPAGPLCLYIHVKATQLPHSVIAPMLDASTSLEEAVSTAPTAEMSQFIKHDLAELGIRNLGDLQSLSPAMFEQLLAAHVETEKGDLWLVLASLRELPLSQPLPMAVVQFHGGEANQAKLPGHLPDVGSLCKLKNKAFYAQKMPVQLLDICEKIRARHDHGGHQNVYTTLRLDEKEHPWFFHMATLVCEFRSKHAHKSWRKQDATRPIVTSLVTYVDPDLCKCKFNSTRQMVPPSPSMGPRGSSKDGTKPDVGRERTGSFRRECTGPLSAPESPNRGSGRVEPLASPHQMSGSGNRPSIPSIPFPDHWCQCPRQREICVNYELSTPSGSRCSEQNCLGVLASKGSPTSCIRELFVHGGSHKGEDPNPLFPCGVCENMFRRVSKDVFKEHGGADVMLYMFDQEDKPKKLVCLPITEISHRAGTMFKQFVDEEVKEGGNEGETE